jgi:hypothetical protein
MGIFPAEFYKIATILAELTEAEESAFPRRAVAQMMAAMKSTGRGDLDHADLVTFVEELAKTELSQKSSS